MQPLPIPVYFHAEGLHTLNGHTIHHTSSHVLHSVLVLLLHCTNKNCKQDHNEG